MQFVSAFDRALVSGFPDQTGSPVHGVSPSRIPVAAACLSCSLWLSTQKLVSGTLRFR